jgi:hypothetical protein
METTRPFKHKVQITAGEGIFVSKSIAKVRQEYGFIKWVQRPLEATGKESGPRIVMYTHKLHARSEVMQQSAKWYPTLCDIYGHWSSLFLQISVRRRS